MAENQWITLNNQQKMPLLGLGVYKSADGEVESAIKTAVDCGYRLIDTASVYKNEDGVGRGIRKCSVSRSELFITTKVWNTAQRMGDIEGTFNRSLERLNLDYVDLYLVHWPVPGCYLNTWKELEKLYASGRAKSIGVSNFSIQNLEDLSRISDIVPVVNQIEYHPLYVQDELLAYCQEHNIVVQAYAPLARGAYLTREPIMMLANKYGKTPAQIGLRWSVQKGVSVIPKSTKVDRIIGNGQIFDFELTESEIELLNGMNENFRSASIPEDML